MNKKVCCTCEVVVLLIKPIVFLTFSLSSASLDLKVPIVFLEQLQDGCHSTKRIHHGFEHIHPTVNHFCNQYLAEKYPNKCNRQWFIPSIE